MPLSNYPDGVGPYDYDAHSQAQWDEAEAQWIESRDVARKAVRTANRLRKERDKARAQLETSKRAGDILESSLAIVRKERDEAETRAMLERARRKLAVEKLDSACAWSAAWKRKAKLQRWHIKARWHWCEGLYERLTRNYAARRRLIRERNAERRKRRELEAALPIIWRALDGLYGAKHREPIPYDSLPKDRQELFDAALDALAELNEEDAND